MCGHIFITTATNPNTAMALLMLIQLSLLLCTLLTVQLPSFFSDAKEVDCPVTYTTDKWNCTVNCFQNSSSPDSLAVTVQTSDRCTCMQDSSSDIYITGCWSMTVKEDNQIMTLNDNQKCKCHPQTYPGNQCGKNVIEGQWITVEPGEKICISFNKTKNIMMKFSCTRQPPAEICDYTNMQFHSEKKTWIDALEYCRENKSCSLLEITNQSVDCIKNLLSQNNGGSQAWIGLERSIFGNNPKWQWISGLQVNYSMWNSSFPVNSLNNHCGKIIVTERKEIKWLDANCHEQLPFICQSLNSRLYPANAPTLNAELCIGTQDNCKSTC